MTKEIVKVLEELQKENRTKIETLKLNLRKLEAEDAPEIEIIKARIEIRALEAKASYLFEEWRKRI